MIEIEEISGQVPKFKSFNLRASLAQLGNAAYWAFNGVHTSMNEISLRTKKVPDHVKDALKVLFTVCKMFNIHSFNSLVLFSCYFMKSIVIPVCLPMLKFEH